MAEFHCLKCREYLTRIPTFYATGWREQKIVICEHCKTKQLVYATVSKSPASVINLRYTDFTEL